jgi:16S rRNA (guanine527-N7)-methyltransferase
MFHVERAWREAFVDAAHVLHIPLSPDQLNQFEQYLHELLIWNEKVNLTSITAPTEIAIKHFLDSLAVRQALGPGSLLDVGTGAGLPGLPLKILDPARPLTLLEPNHKKTAFLRHLIGTLGLPGITVQSRRLEELAQAVQEQPADSVEPRHPRQAKPSRQPIERFANIVTRAVAALPLLRDIRVLLGEEGRFIWCRTQPLDVAVNDHGLAVLTEIPYALPGVDARVLTVLRRA